MRFSCLYWWIFLFILVDFPVYIGGFSCLYWWIFLVILVDFPVYIGGFSCLYWWIFLFILVDFLVYIGGFSCLYWWISISLFWSILSVFINYIFTFLESSLLFLSHFYNIDYVYNLVCHTVYTNIYINGSIKEYNTNMSAMFPLLNDDSNCKGLFVYLWST